MECLNQTVDRNIWKSAHVESDESDLNKDMPDTDLGVNFIPQGEPDEEREKVKEILHQHYCLTLKSCQRLDGFDDANYLVAVDGNYLHANSSQYILRIINAEDSRDPDRIQAINEAMKHVHTKGIVTQLPVANLQGQEISFFTMKTEATSTKHVVVLRTFVPGTSMVSLTLTPNDVFNFGVYVSLISQAFEDFHHPFFDSFQFSWSIENRPHFRKMLSSLEESSQRRLLEKIVDTVDKKLSQIRHHLKRGQIHGDMGTSNVILPHENDSHLHSGQDSTQKTSTVIHWGLVDFHDTHWSYRIYELASTAARMMSTSQPMLLDRLDIPGHLLAGYQTTIHLDSFEREVFPYLVISCLCNTVAGCQYHLTLNPGNVEYLQRDLCNTLLALKSLWEMTPRKAQIKWEYVVHRHHDNV